MNALNSFNTICMINGATIAHFLCIQIETNEKEWKVWYESEKPEAEEIPCSYSTTLDGFRKLLLIRSWSPDRTISQAKKYIEGSLNFTFDKLLSLHLQLNDVFISHKIESLGPEYSEMLILDLDVTWSESEPRTPLVCILSIGSDPTSQIATLAKNKNIRTYFVFLLVVCVSFFFCFQN